MKTLGYYNGKFDEIENMTIPMIDRVSWFGDGIYDATYSHNHKIFDLDHHLTRFYNSAKILEINIPIPKDELAKLLAELVLKVDDGDQFVYMQCTRGSAPRNHIYDADMKGNLWVTLTPQPVADTYTPIDVITFEDKGMPYDPLAKEERNALIQMFRSLRMARSSPILLMIRSFPAPRGSGFLPSQKNSAMKPKRENTLSMSL